MTLASGTIIPVILDTELSTNKSFWGDTFTASIDKSREAYCNILPGASIKGVVRVSSSLNGNDPGILELAFTSMRMADGTTYPLSGSVMNMDAGQFTISSKGLLLAKSPGQNRRLTFVGVGYGSSALVSAPDGGKLSLKDLAMVGIADYDAHSALANPDRLHDVDLKPGTPMGVLLIDQLSFSLGAKVNASTPMYHRIAVRDGTKYYQFHGRSWALDLATGDRYPTSSVAPVMGMPNGKYYSFLGHAYYMDPDTGERTQLD